MRLITDCIIITERYVSQCPVGSDMILPPTLLAEASPDVRALPSALARLGFSGLFPLELNDDDVLCDAHSDTQEIVISKRPTPIVGSSAKV